MKSMSEMKNMKNGTMSDAYFNDEMEAVLEAEDGFHEDELDEEFGEESYENTL